jgi:myo-inositol 2-dehydrogenase/D-chiro-inositol 1-dehydrogenase
LNFFMQRYLDSYEEELRAFVHGLRDDAPVPVSGADARAPVVLAMAAMRSLETGAAVDPRSIS